MADEKFKDSKEIDDEELGAVAGGIMSQPLMMEQPGGGMGDGMSIVNEMMNMVKQGNQQQGTSMVLNQQNESMISIFPKL